ncbi:BQ2448_3866 [Microbotryum intermedium]|uniref:BQ2448_3866 protein n=1 Tax=Microbotryum intermedium TaxID=269621 RepID=A0A238FHR4_9BASI|nr:BQ2448_3866 [Microbotryum intermedium]
MILASALVSTVLAAGSLSPIAKEKCDRLANYCRNCPSGCSKNWRSNSYMSANVCQATECWAPQPKQGTIATAPDQAGWCTKATDALTCLAGCETGGR